MTILNEASTYFYRHTITHIFYCFQIIYSHSSKGPIEIEKEFDLIELKENLTSVLPTDFDTECQLSG